MRSITSRPHVQWNVFDYIPYFCVQHSFGTKIAQAQTHTCQTFHNMYFFVLYYFIGVQHRSIHNSFVYVYIGAFFRSFLNAFGRIVIIIPVLIHTTMIQTYIYMYMSNSHKKGFLKYFFPLRCQNTERHFDLLPILKFPKKCMIKTYSFKDINKIYNILQVNT